MDIDDWAVDVFAVEHIGRGSPRCAGEQFFHVETVFGPMRIGGTCRRESQLPIGRASCRESVCQYVSISVVAGSFKHKKRTDQLSENTIVRQKQIASYKD